MTIMLKWHQIIRYPPKSFSFILILNTLTTYIKSLLYFCSNNLLKRLSLSKSFLNYKLGLKENDIFNENI